MTSNPSNPFGLTDPIGPHLAPDGYDDPLVSQIEWTPVACDSVETMGSRDLRRLAPNAWQLRASRHVRFLMMAVLMVALACLLWAGWIILGLFAGQNQNVALAGALLVICMILSRPCELIDTLSGLAPIRIDLNLGWLWQGRRPAEGDQTDLKARRVRIESIHALQLLFKSIHTPGADYPAQSYELNLITHGGQRMNLLDNRLRHEALGHAKNLAEILDVPLWKQMGR